jgi:hypothetical protein
MKVVALLAGLPIIGWHVTSYGTSRRLSEGSVVGGVAGHYAGHHGLLTAGAGCLVGRYYAYKRARADDARPLLLR